MLPVVELRGAVPVGAWLGVPPLRAFIVCVLGNSLAVFLLLAALRLPPVEALLRPVLERARAKMGGLGETKSLPLALAVFVGVPLPGTGGWTGAMIAHLLGMPFALAFGSIFAGVVMAGVIMSALTLAGWYGAAVAAGVLAVFCTGALMKRKD
ncbi:putative small multi-drug export protein-domain-containing protein [Pavlovales sp. CCMP2436]|nr:putative small multi-drug export protein-domain-containing protein [Pavlovales sp. CCMP2436]